MKCNPIDTQIYAVFVDALYGIICDLFFAKNNDDKSKEVEMGGACSTNLVGEKCVQKFGVNA